MEKQNKKLLSVTVLLICLAGMAGIAVADEEKAPAPQEEKETAEYEQAQPELTLWYTDDSMSGYLYDCAKKYYEESGIAVDVVLKDSLGFVESIYQTSMDDAGYPDIYMIQNDSLGKAYLYGLAAENEDADVFRVDDAGNAVTASSCGGKMYAYPLTFHTPVFVYRSDVFATAPASVEQIFAMAQNDELGLIAGNLIEWNVADEFYDFPFVGESFSFDENDMGNLSVTTDEARYAEELAFFGGLTETIDLDTETMTRKQVLDDFNSGATLSAIIDSWDLGAVNGDTCQVAALPAMNDTLSMRGGSYTELLVVNAFTEKEKKAADFASYVATEAMGDFEAQTGHIPVKGSVITDETSRIIYNAYENSVSIPNTMDVEDFLRELKNRMTAVWNGAPV